MKKSKISSWLHSMTSRYFRRRVLPHWCVLLADSLILFTACFFTYWVSNRTSTTLENMRALTYTAIIYTAMSWVGALLFKTYSGVMRYSSFVDLMKLSYANLVTAILTVGWSFTAPYLGWTSVAALTPLETIVTIIVSTMLMWTLRVLVKQLFEQTNTLPHTEPVLIYGALSGGIGMAKSIKSHRPVQFNLRGFISHEKKIRDMQLMGVPVYNLDQDIAAVIKKEGIK